MVFVLVCLVCFCFAVTELITHSLRRHTSSGFNHNRVYRQIKQTICYIEISFHHYCLPLIYAVILLHIMKV
ncbi:hypothetical protein BDD12DRAFT_817317 [Trichophaea hybrida]|nr:hypothetical protein BDD12DRAFT_817317 [Trichophaea hybrida]